MSTRDTTEVLKATDSAAACRLSWKQWGCDYCKIYFPSRQILKKHLLDAHSVTQQYENDDVIQQYDEDTMPNVVDAAIGRLSRNLELGVRQQCDEENQNKIRTIQAQEPSSSASGQHLSPVQVISNSKCKGCSFEGKSLRGHLKRTSKDCLSQYSTEELHALENNAKSIQREQTSQWKKNNREAASAHERRRYHQNTPEKDNDRK